MPRRKKAGKRSSDVTTSYLDINQLELAFINRAINSRRRLETPSWVEIGRSKRILRLQKKNLVRLCRKMKRECREGRLESELGRLLGGKRRLSIRCFMFR